MHFLLINIWIFDYYYDEVRKPVYKNIYLNIPLFLVIRKYINIYFKEYEILAVR